MIVKVNLRSRKFLAGILLAGFVVVPACVGCWWWGRSQHLAQLVAAAEEAEKADDWTTAETKLRQLAVFRPDDAQIARRIARAIIRDAQADEQRIRAIPFLFRSYSLAPCEETRLSLAELQLIRSPTEALRHAESVLREKPEHVRARVLQAYSLVAIGEKKKLGATEVKKAWRGLMLAAEEHPSSVSPATSMISFLKTHRKELALVELETEEEHTALVWSVMNQLVERNETEVQARLLRLSNAGLFGAVDSLEQYLDEDAERLLDLIPESKVARRIAAARLVAKSSTEQPQETPPQSQNLEQALAVLRPIGESDQVDLLFSAQIHWLKREFDTCLQKLTNLAANHEGALHDIRAAEVAIALEEWTAAEDALAQVPREQAAFAEKQFSQAADLLLAQVYLSPANPKRDYRKALSLVDRVAKQGAKGGLAALTHFLRAQCNAALGEWTNAESEFRKTLQFASSSQPARIGLAVCLTQQGRFEEARLELSNALTASLRESRTVPDWKIHVQIARTCLLQRRSRFESQLPSEFKESIEALSGFPPARASREILMLEALRGGDSSSTDFASFEAKAIERCGNTPDFWRMYVNYLSRQRRWQEAGKAIESLEAILGEDQVALRLRLAYAEGDREAAVCAISKLHQTGQITPQEHALLELRVEFAIGDRAKALERAGALLKKYPQETRFMRELANIAWVEGNALLVSAAMDAMEESGLCSARELQILDLKLNWLRCLQRSAKAEDVAALRTALKQLSSRQDLSQQDHLLLAQCSDSLGMKRAAVVHYLEAFTRGCESEMVALRLARLLYERSQADKALDILLTIDGPQERALSAAMICEILPELSVSPHKHATLERYLESVAKEGEQGSSFDFALFLSNYAMLKSRTGEPEVGIRFLRAAIAEHPDSVVLKNNLALLLSQHNGAYTEALELLESALLITGSNATLLDSKAHVLSGQGSHDASIQSMLQSIELAGPAKASQLLLLAGAHKELGEHQLASDYLKDIDSKEIQSLPPESRKRFYLLRSQLNES